MSGARGGRSAFLLVLALTGLPPGAATATATGPTFFAHLPAAGCVPPSPAQTDRLVTCDGGLDTAAPGGGVTQELTLQTSSTSDPQRTATFAFLTPPLGSTLVVGEGDATARVFLHALGGAAGNRPADLAVELHRRAGGGADTPLGAGTLAGQTLGSGTDAYDAFMIPYQTAGSLSDRTLAVGDQLVFLIRVKNTSVSNWKVVLGFDAAARDTQTGALAPGCVPGAGPDADGDGVPDFCDDCIFIPDPAQADANLDGVGDACECTSDALPGTCVPGGGSPATDCTAEFLPIGATVTASSRTGLPLSAVGCADGDPSCDADGAADGRCRLRVILCLNNTDARLGCVPSSVQGMQIRAPSPKRPHDQADRDNLAALDSAGGALGLELPDTGGAGTPGSGNAHLNACARPIELVIPLKGQSGAFRRARRRFQLRFFRVDAGGRRKVVDSDSLDVTCTPGTGVPPTTSTTTSTVPTGSTTTSTLPSTPLGPRTFSVANGPVPAGSQFFSTGLGDTSTPISKRNSFIGSIALAAGAPGPDGVATLTVDQDSIFGFQVVDNSFVCFELEAAGSTGKIDCDGGTPVGVSWTQDSNGSGDPGPPSQLTEQGGPGQPGDGYIVFSMRGANCPDGSNPSACGTLTTAADCADPTKVDFSLATPEMHVFTTGTSTATVLHTVQSQGASNATISKTGQPFSCSNWTANGILEMPLVGFDNSIGGDTANTVQLDD